MMHFITVILEILILIVLYEMTVVHKPDNKGRLLILAVRRDEVGQVSTHQGLPCPPLVDTFLCSQIECLIQSNRCAQRSDAIDQALGQDAL